MNSIHASCIAFGSFGVLLRGEAGSGKSSLCLRLIDGEGFGLGQRAMRAQLVADDQVVIQNKSRKLLASPPQALAGKLEIRGLGIVHVKHRKSVELKLVVDLKPAKIISRLPELGEMQIERRGVTLPYMMLDASLPDAAAKLRTAVTQLRKLGIF